MKLLDLIPHLKNRKNSEKLISEKLPNVSYDLAEIYMVETLSIESEIHFFDSRGIINDISIEINRIKYINFFPFYLAQELIEEYCSLLDISDDLELANKLLEYRINDA